MYCSSITALMYASENGQYEIVELLLKVEGIDVNAKDNLGKTALFCAYEKLLKNRHELHRENDFDTRNTLLWLNKLIKILLFTAWNKNN
jgi:ankyrin repeat protein